MTLVADSLLRSTSGPSPGLVDFCSIPSDAMTPRLPLFVLAPHGRITNLLNQDNTGLSSGKHKNATVDEKPQIL